MNLAPIALFVYNRPWHTEQTLTALSQNTLADQSMLYIFCDGPKNNASQDDLENIKSVRKIVSKKKWCKNIIIRESKTNQGLAKSVISGIDFVFNNYEKIIVLEDDILTSSCFLNFMNSALEQYAESTNIFNVNGYMFPIKFPSENVFLLPYISTWGWGTWKNRWKYFEYKAPQKNLIITNPYIKQRFNLADYNYSKMLDIDPRNSWGIFWYYSIFIRNGLSLFPTKSMVSNIGNDGTGTNSQKTETFKDGLTTNFECKFVDTMNLEYLNLFQNHFRKRNNVSTIEKILSFFKKKLGNQSR